MEDLIKRGENSKNNAFIKLNLANKSISLRLNTGTEVNAMPKKTFQQFELKPTEVRFTLYGGKQSDVAEQCLLECEDM